MGGRGRGSRDGEQGGRGRGDRGGGRGDRGGGRGDRGGGRGFDGGGGGRSSDRGGGGRSFDRGGGGRSFDRGGGRFDGGGRGRGGPSMPISEIMRSTPFEPVPIRLDPLARPVSLADTPVELIPFAKRPSYGKGGKAVNLFCNHYNAAFNPAGIIHQYDFSLQGTDIMDVPRKKLRTIMDTLLKQHKAMFGKCSVAFDGRSIVYAAPELPFGNDAVFKITIEEEEGQKPKSFDIKLMHSAERNLSDLQLFMDGRKSESPVDCINALDVVLRTIPLLKMTSAGRNFYSPTHDYPLSGGAEVWLGYFQSLRLAQAGLTFNADLAASAFLKVMPLMDFVAQLMNLRDSSQLERALSDQRGKTQMEKFVKHVNVNVTHRPTKRAYRISGVSRQSASQTKIVQDDGKEGPSIADYFAAKYKKTLRYPGLPMVRVGPSNKQNFLPIELCQIAEGQRINNGFLKLTDRQTAELIKVACRRPEERRSIVHEEIKVLMPALNAHAQLFGVEVKPTAIAMTGRVLPPPVMKYANGDDRPSNGKWNMVGKKFTLACSLNCWAVVSFCSERDMPRLGLQQFVGQFTKAANSVGMKVGMEQPPILMMSEYGRDVSHADILRDAVKRANDALKGKGITVQIILCIIPAKGLPEYAHIKRATDTLLGVPSQCMILKHALDAKPQVLTNILLKVNAKLGGRNAVLASSPVSRPPLNKSPTIIFGADVHHPGPGSGRPSIAAVVASMDQYCARHAAVVRVQDARKEVITDLQSIVRGLILLFKEETKAWPMNILFLRDGVSEGQFRQVLKFEVRAIEEACRNIDAKYRPKITFLTCQKRHHTRLYAIDPKDMDNSGNISAGTVVDTAICHPHEFDFFLCSHSGLQGTSRPTKYSVLWDEIGFTPDQLYSLLFETCFLQARCTRSVSIPPAVYYAHLAAFRAQHFVKDDSDIQSSASSGVSSTDWTEKFSNVHEALKNVMYFI